MKTKKAIELLEEHEARLQILLNHRDCTHSFGAYIREFLLNKEFYQALADERSAEAVTSEPSELYKMFHDGNFGDVKGKTLYYETEISDDCEHIGLTVYHRETDKPMNSGVLLYDSIEELDWDLMHVVLDFEFHLVDEGAWTDEH